MRNPYDILGLAKGASEAEIKKAFRKLAKSHHPDRTSDPKSKEKFAEANTAYEILGDAKKRAQFDRGEIDAEGKPRFQGFNPGAGRGFEGEEGFSPFGFGRGGPFAGRARAGGAGAGAGVGEDIFSQIFGEAFSQGERGAGARRAAGAAAASGADVNATLTLTLEDIASDAKSRIQLPGGREVEVTIPPGVADGQVIRLKGLGQPSARGGEPGDVMLTLRLAPHEHFTPEGADLRLRLAVELDEAVLGGPVRVPTLTGAVEMAIPPMTSSGRTFRLRGKGLPTKTGRGDILATVEIRLPKEADEALLAYAKARRGAKAV